MVARLKSLGWKPDTSPRKFDAKTLADIRHLLGAKTAGFVAALEPALDWTRSLQIERTRRWYVPRMKKRCDALRGLSRATAELLREIDGLDEFAVEDIENSEDAASWAAEEIPATVSLKYLRMAAEALKTRSDWLVEQRQPRRGDENRRGPEPDRSRERIGVAVARAMEGQGIKVTGYLAGDFAFVLALVLEFEGKVVPGDAGMREIIKRSRARIASTKRLEAVLIRLAENPQPKT